MQLACVSLLGQRQSAYRFQRNRALLALSGSPIFCREGGRAEDIGRLRLRLSPSNRNVRTWGPLGPLAQRGRHGAHWDPRPNGATWAHWDPRPNGAHGNGAWIEGGPTYCGPTPDPGPPSAPRIRGERVRARRALGLGHWPRVPKGPYSHSALSPPSHPYPRRQGTGLVSSN